MIERDSDGNYEVKSDEAAIVIRQSGEVELLMPDSDIAEDETFTTDSPTFKGMVIMAFIRNRALREQVAEELIKEFGTET